MKLSAWATIFYAAFLVVGGIMGYVYGKSVISLVASSFFALFLFGSSISMLRGQSTGRYSALVYVLLLDGFFTYRFLKTKALMPSGLMCVVSLVLIVTLILQIRKQAKKPV